MRIILASASRQRGALLKKAGVDFLVEKSGYRENLQLPLPPPKLAKHLALGKANAVAARHTSGIVLGADTIVVRRGEIFGKPKGAADARRMLRSLSGRTHSVITAYALKDAKTGRALARSATTRVTFRALSASEIEQYVAGGEGKAAAGAYAIQGKGASFVRRLAGDRDNVIGLPVAQLKKDLRAFVPGRKK